MTTERFINRSIELLRYISPQHFRTVASFEMKKAPSEVNVEIEMKDRFMKRLSFYVPWDGKLYAYAQKSQSFLKLCADNGMGKEDIKAIYLEDWDDKFLMVIEGGGNRRELAFFVSDSDMLTLLQNCLRIPSQK